MKAKRFFRFASILAVLSLFYSMQISAKFIITVQPVGGTYCVGESVSLSISTTAYKPTYQWYWISKIGTMPIPAEYGGTSQTMSIGSIQIAQTGGYYCIVSSGTESETSATASIIVISPPTITGGTSGYFDLCEGENTLINVSATSSGTIYYQWQKNGTNISGANSDEIYFSSLTTASDGDYRCKLSHSVNTCTVTSSTTTITVNTPSTDADAIIHNGTAPFCEGDEIEFSVQGGSLGNYAVWHWYLGNSSNAINEMPLGTGASIITNLTGSNYYYWVRAEDGICDDTYGKKVLVSLTPKPILTSASVSDCCKGLPASFHVEGSLGGGPDEKWVWKQFNSTIFTTKENTKDYTLYNPGLNNFTVTTEGGCGNTSLSASNTVKTAPSITQDLAITEKCEGESHTLQVTATGSAPLTYRFNKNGIPFTSWISSNSQTLNNLTEADEALYKVEVQNDCSPDDESSAQLTINPLPAINLGNDISICQGESASIGTDLSYPNYSWNTGPTTAKITVTDENNYILTVTDANYCSNSDDIVVNVDEHINPVSLGEDRSYCMGDDALIDAGTGYDQYNWSTGQNGVSSISVSETGNYSVSVKNNGNVCTSEDEVNIIVHKPFEEEEICMVLIDPDTRKNMIVWEKTPDVRTEKYQVWKVTANPHELIDEVTYGDTSVVIDMNSKPTAKADAYVLVVIDSCGNASEPSLWHKPFLLQSSLGLEDVVNLNWQPYLMDNIEFNFESIVIFRGTDSLLLSPIDTMYSGFDQYSYTDVKPPKGVNLYYRIGGEKLKACDPNGLIKQKTTAGPYVHSLSNLEDNRLKETGIFASSEQIKIYPNPMTDATYLDLRGINSQGIVLRICDLSGRVVRESVHYENTILIERNNLKSGCYLVRIYGDKQYSGILMIK